ncbi:MAG: thioesterase family protein [Polyangiales bacterium]
MDIAQLTPLAQVLSLRSSGAVFKTEIPGDWTQGRTTFGGLLAAIAIRALEAGHAEGRPLCSFVMDCIGPAAAGGIEVHTELLRAGKSLSHVRATLLQDGKLCAALIGAFGLPRASLLNDEGAPPPPVATPPETLARLPYVADVSPRFTQHFDYRFMTTSKLFSGAKEGQLSGFVKPLDADQVDAAVIAALIDAFPAPVLTQLRAPAPVSTVTWMVNFARRPEPLATDAYYRYESRTNSATDGYASMDATLWDADGRLLADSRQLIAVFG